MRKAAEMWEDIGLGAGNRSGAGLSDLDKNFAGTFDEQQGNQWEPTLDSGVGVTHV